MLTRRLHGQGQDTEWETEAQYEDEIVRRSALTLWLSTHLLTTLLTRSEFYRKRRILIIGWSRHEETLSFTSLPPCWCWVHCQPDDVFPVLSLSWRNCSLQEALFYTECK